MSDSWDANASCSPLTTAEASPPGTLHHAKHICTAFGAAERRQPMSQAEALCTACIGLAEVDQCTVWRADVSRSSIGSSYARLMVIAYPERAFHMLLAWLSSVCKAMQGPLTAVSADTDTLAGCRNSTCSRYSPDRLTSITSWQRWVSQCPEQRMHFHNHHHQYLLHVCMLDGVAGCRVDEHGEWPSPISDIQPLAVWIFQQWWVWEAVD